MPCTCEDSPLRIELQDSKDFEVVKVVVRCKKCGTQQEVKANPLGEPGPEARN